MIAYKFREFSIYNKLANESMNKVIGNITEEEWNRKFSGFYKSIHELCSHIYFSDFGWLKRFGQLRDFNIYNKDIMKTGCKFSKTMFKNIDEYIQKRMNLDDTIIEFIDELSDDDLEKSLKLPDSGGNIIECKMDALLFHVFTHQTHSRGMISLYLELLGKENDFS